jgi:hypothetical protein
VSESPRELCGSSWPALKNMVQGDLRIRRKLFLYSVITARALPCIIWCYSPPPPSAGSADYFSIVCRRSNQWLLAPSHCHCTSMSVYLYLSIHVSQECTSLDSIIFTLQMTGSMNSELSHTCICDTSSLENTRAMHPLSLGLNQYCLTKNGSVLFSSFATGFSTASPAVLSSLSRTHWLLSKLQNESKPHRMAFIIGSFDATSQRNADKKI